MRNIRRYTNAFQMNSFKSKQVVKNGLMHAFKIQGQVYHLAGSLLPLRPDDHKFQQIYFIADPDTLRLRVFQQILLTLVAVVIAGQQFDKRDIVLHSRDDNLQKISELHRSYNSLQYPLMLCRGENGYAINISHVDQISGTPLYITVSCINYYCYLIMTRRHNFNTFLRYGILTN